MRSKRGVKVSNIIWEVEYKRLPMQKVHSILVKAESEGEARTLANNLLVVGNYKDLEVEGIEVLKCSRN